MQVRLQEYRWKRDYSIEQLARLSGVSSSQISRIENGVSIPTVEIMCRLARALNCKLSDLVDCE